MTKYSYDGPVYQYGKCVDPRWKGQTMAISEKKARSNLAYQWKKQTNQMAYTGPIVLTGKLKAEDK